MAIQDDELIRYALIGLEEEKRRIEEKVAELRATAGSSASPNEGAKTPGTRKKMSAAARKRMAAAQRARWAKQRDTTRPQVSGTGPALKTRTMSPEARERIAEAQRKRWAATKKNRK